MRPGLFRLALGLGGVALLTAATACASSSTTGDGSSGTALAGSCGKIPTVAYDDQSGLVAKLGGYAANYNGFDGTIYSSPWSSWAGKSSGVKVGVLIDGLSSPYQPELEAALDSDLKAFGYSTVTLVPSSASVTNQLQGYQTLLNDKVNLIVVQAQSPTAYNSLIDKAAKEGVPTVAVLNEVTDANAVNVVPNSVLSGMKLAQYVVQHIGGKGLVMFLHGIAGAPIDTDTANGANDVLKECPGITTNESIQTQFEASVAKQDMTSYLSTHTQSVGGVITAGPFTSGVIEAFQQAGKTVPITTNNGLDDGGLAYWYEHKSSYTGVGLDNTATGLAYAAAQVAHKMLRSDGVKLNTLAIDSPLVTSANLSQFVDPSWTINTAGTATGPNSLYISNAYIDAIFSK